jgi:hypothetical protein
MYAHIWFSGQTQYGAKLRSLLNKMEQSDDEMADVRDVMIQMRDGDGSAAAHYARVTSMFGFDTDAMSKAAFDELESAYSKTSGNGSVSNVRAARDQLFAKLRG